MDVLIGLNMMALCVKNSPEMQADAASIPGLGRAPWRSRKWQPTPVSLLKNSMDRGDWRVTVRGVGKSRTRLSARSIRGLIIGTV